MPWPAVAVLFLPDAPRRYPAVAGRIVAKNQCSEATVQMPIGGASVCPQRRRALPASVHGLVATARACGERAALH